MTFSGTDHLGRRWNLGDPTHPQPLWQSGADPRIEQIRGALKTVPQRADGDAKTPESAAIAAIRLILETP